MAIVEAVRAVRYLLLPGVRAAGLTSVAAKGEAGVIAFAFGCLGFLCSRLLRF